MADLQQQLERLQRSVDDVTQRASREDVSGEVAQLEKTARELLSDAKNTPHERTAQNLFARLANLNTSATSPTTATIRGLLRRARIRIEIAGDDDDIDEAIDILSQAIALNASDEDTIDMLIQAGRRTPQARQRVNDLFDRYGIKRTVDNAAPAPSTPATPPPNSVEMPTQEAPRVPPSSSVLDDLGDITPPPPRFQTSAGYPPPEENLYSRREANDMPNRTTQSISPFGGNAGNDLDTLLSELTQTYYSGEYQQTVDVANRILALQPTNPTALEYREKSEDNLIRGVVPDHRIPFDARVSYNRANSLVRAGNYEEAERLYREARDLAERSGILSWKDAEQAMLDIQDLALAREMLTEGDRLMASDSWSEALRKYEGALRVVPNDPQAEERVETIRRVQQDSDQVAVQLGMMSGSLSEQVAQLQNVVAILTRIRQLLPNSQRLNKMQADVDTKLTGIKTQIYDQAQAALDRANNATALDEKLTQSNEALRLLELGLELDPSDGRTSELINEARAISTNTQRARQSIERAAALTAQNFDNELGQARTMLAELYDYAQDERYRNVVNDLLARFVERAEIALEDGQMAEAQAWLDSAREEPFRVLGRRPEIQRLDTQLRAERQRNRITVFAVIGGIIIVLSVAAFLTRQQWEPIINPPPTETPTPTLTTTPTFTPSATPTASDTPTPSHTPTNTQTPSRTPTPTDTSTPTWTVTPSLTVTPSETPTETLTPTHTPTITPSHTPTSTPTETAIPSITPTPPVLCEVGVISQRINVRASPSVTATQITVVGPGTRMEVTEQQRLNDTVWYRIRLNIEGNLVQGWVREDTVSVLGDACPTLPGAAPAATDEG